MQFVKMHGIGNDYIYINGFENTVADPAALARVIADRHTGVGGDGLVLVLSAQTDTQADVRMRMFNADGSEAEMCGNAIRCVCKLAHDSNITTANPMRIQTPIGVLTLDYQLNSAGEVADVTVDMGSPILEPVNIPVNIAGVAQVVDHPIADLIDLSIEGLPDRWIDACGLDRRMTCVSMGNPHVTFYCNDVARIPLPFVGPMIETHALFPNRINIHFVQVVSAGEVIMRTWERGSGATEACGTGACAVCAAGVLTGRTATSLLAHLPGGDLHLQWPNTSAPIKMTGPATKVFTGDWPED
jgi:diaminopimelate epimerase